MKQSFIKKLFLLFSLIYTSVFFAQGNRFFNMDEAVTMFDQTKKTSLRAATLPQLQWVPNMNSYSFVQNNRLMICQTTSERIDSSIDLSKLNSSIANFNSKISLKVFPIIQWQTSQSFRFLNGQSYLLYNILTNETEELINLPKGTAHHEFIFSQKKMAYVSENNIFVFANNSSKQITNDGGKGIVYGQSVHRNEFGISKGLFWSPNGNKLAFYRMDESMVTDYSIYDNSSLPAKNYTIKYPVAGEKSHHVTIGIYDLNTQKTVYLETGLPQEQYLTNISFSPDEQFIYVMIVNRGQNQMFLNRYDANQGHIDINLFEERNEKWVEPEHPIEFVPNNPNQFIYQSEKDGFNHLYLYNTNGKMIRQLTYGNWIVTDFKGFDPTGEILYFECTKESPLERHLYSVNIYGKELTKISQETGMNFTMLNDDKSMVINVLNSPTIPRKIDLYSSQGKIQKEIFNAPNPLADFKLGETTVFPIKNENTILYARMITPPDFDKTKKYPVIVYVYGGPHLQLINNSWLNGSNLWMQLMAQKGFIVFSLDNRGSANRGFEFESAVFRQLGNKEMEDQIAGINYLKKLSYVDADRIGVHGWSFGGFMTTSLMTRQKDVFKVGVAGGPVIDWALYEIMYTERYMDSPKENPEGYKNSKLTNYIQNLDGRLLMIHGCDDDVVLWQHSLMYIKSAVDAGNTNLDYFVYPGHQHNVQGKDRVHLMQKITNYFIDNL